MPESLHPRPLALTSATLVAALLAALSISCVEPPWPLTHNDGDEAERRLEPGRLASVSEVLAATPDGRTSAVVLDSRSRLVFGHAVYERYELASVAKVYILVAYLDRLAHEGRGPGPEELDLMRSMIEYSDNGSATALFQVLGGVDSINAFLQSHAMEPLDPAFDGSWGSMGASALQVGELLTRLYRDRLLDPGSSALALSMLASVVEEQSWGVGRAADTGRGGVVYFKNGWLPQEDGWIVHSIGLLSEGSQRYVLVFMTDQQESFEGTVEMIERAVTLARSGLFPPTATPSPSVTVKPRPTVAGTPGPATDAVRESTTEPGTALPEGCPPVMATPLPEVEIGGPRVRCP